VDGLFKDVSAFFFTALMVEAVSNSETSVCFYKTTGAVTEKAVIFMFAAMRI
jgi:hypothetical protein